MCLQNQSSPWPSEYLMKFTHSAISDLSHYIFIIHKTWGKSQRAWGERV